jgi:hypothetical protein
MSTVIKKGTLAGEIKGDDTGSLWTRLLDVAGNGIAKAQRAVVLSTQEFLMIAGKNDSYATAIRTDRKGNILTGNYIPELIEQFEGNTTNTSKWTPSVTTFAQSQSTITGLQLNTSANLTAGAFSILTSQRVFQKIPRVPLQVKQRLRHNLVNNSYGDFGFGIPTGSTLIVPNGIAVRFVSSNLIQAVLTYNNIVISNVDFIAKTTFGSNVIGSPLTMADAVFTNNFYTYDVIVDDDNVVITIQDTENGEMIGIANIPVPRSILKMWGATSLPFYYRTVNSGVVTQSPIFNIAEIQGLSLDWNINMSASEVAGNLGLSGDRNPYTGASLANYANSTAPVSATLSNTVGGYGATVKDGKFQFVAPLGAITDYALFGFQVPIGSRYQVEGVRIDTRNTGAIVATTATTIEWGIAVNNPIVSLANAIAIRTFLGQQVFPIGTAIEGTANYIDIDFKTPMVCESGRFINLICTIPSGTATAGQIIRGGYTLKGRFL